MYYEKFDMLNFNKRPSWFYSLPIFLELKLIRKLSSMIDDSHNLFAAITGGLDLKLAMWDFSKGRPYHVIDYGKTGP